MTEVQTQNKPNVVPLIGFVLITIIVIFIVSYLFIINFFSKKAGESTSLNSPETITTNFPVGPNDFNTHSFNCFVQNLIENLSQDLQTNQKIIVGVECTYFDLELKPHTIKVPLMVKDSQNNYLTSNRYYPSSEYSWKESDYMNNLSRFYYLNNDGKENYDDPNSENNNYFTNSSAKKPTISKGDMLAVSFALENSSIFFDPTLGQSASFFHDYHDKIVGYEKISRFLQDGKNPELLFSETENWIIPTWVIFAKDNNI